MQSSPEGVHAHCTIHDDEYGKAAGGDACTDRHVRETDEEQWAELKIKDQKSNYKDQRSTTHNLDLHVQTEMPQPGQAEGGHNVADEEQVWCDVAERSAVRAEHS